MPETDEIICRGLFDTVEVRAIDEDTRTATFVAATENGVETMFGREHLRLSGMDLTRFRKNPVVLDTHNLHEAGAIIGSGVIVVAKRELSTSVKFAKTLRAEEIWQLVLQGFLRAMSVGFRALEVQMLDEGEHSGIGQNRIEGPARIIKKSELLEVSVVPVGVDADAVRRGFLEGNERELNSQIRALTGAVNQLLEPSTTEQTMPKDEKETTKPTAAPAKEAENTSERAAAAVEPLRPESPEEIQTRQLKARRESVMACVPESLRGFADGLLITRSLTVDDILGQVREKYAAEREAVGTTEPTEIENRAAGGDDKPPKVADIEDDVLLRSVGA